MKLLCVNKSQKGMQKHVSSMDKIRNFKLSKFIHLASEWMLVGSSLFQVLGVGAEEAAVELEALLMTLYDPPFLYFNLPKAPTHFFV